MARRSRGNPCNLRDSNDLFLRSSGFKKLFLCNNSYLFALTHMVSTNNNYFETVIASTNYSLNLQVFVIGVSHTKGSKQILLAL